MSKLLQKLNKKDVFFMLICFCLIVFQVWLELKLPDYMSNITRLVQTTTNNMGEILIQGGYMMMCALAFRI